MTVNKSIYNLRQLALKYLRWYGKASNGRGHGVHSPFVFDFITHVLNDRTHYPAYDKVESLRRRLLKDRAILPVTDFGAGSSMAGGERRSVSSLARHAAKSKRLGQLLYRVARYYQVNNAVELGTSLGISAAYLSMAIENNGYLYTVEGAAAVAERAGEHLAGLGCGNVNLYNLRFEEAIPRIKADCPRIDLLFVDGNHRKEPTLDYFVTFLPQVPETGVMIFDDIHWSPGMEAAWETIQKHPAVTCTIDLFFIGLVFFRPGFHQPQHYRIRFRG